jgi:hypothetical protein
MIKLGYTDDDVRNNFSKNEEMIGKLYHRLL